MFDFTEINIPNIIESERLRLIAPDLAYSTAINEAIIESWDSLNRWMPWAVVKPSLLDTEAAWGNFAEEWAQRKSFNMLILSKDDSRFLGVCGIPRLDWTVPKFEIGYWLRDSEVSKGFMREAVELVVEFSFTILQAKRVEIVCDSRNVRSARVAEALGFQKEAHLKNHGRANDGSLRDTLIYGLTKDPL